jgi:hypothetical protein
MSKNIIHKNVTHKRAVDGVIMHLLVNGTIMTKAACISEIESDIVYETAPSTAPGEIILVCTDKEGNKYLRTKGNETFADNLDMLPDFELPDWYLTGFH